MAMCFTAPSARPISPPGPFLRRGAATALPLASASFPSNSGGLGSVAIGLRRHCPPTRPGDLLMVRAGSLTASSLALVFLLPLSLLVGTILVSIRVADRLDEKFLQELAENKAMMEENEVEEEEGAEEYDLANVIASEETVLVKAEDGVAAPRVSRNRPKREV
ncbi:hypothetical protein AXF42_Ash004481 [Apostasia shenzhenica]|uniref:High chlorophyll fluorescence 153 n=1 Tax=Apostasia shenzhenica TaxID=1088818 RepID=A0A2I0BGQ9_9ASPA|nr:hypothetical protein AXF42_Ash004481 [Apostasia shenzhenica]